MQIFAQTQDQARERISSGVARPKTAAPAPIHPIHPGAAAAPRVAHDFSRISVYPRTPLKAQPGLTADTPGDIHEQEANRAAGHSFGEIPVHAASAPPATPPDAPAVPRIHAGFGQAPRMPLLQRTPLIQRAPAPEDEIHQPLIEQYRREAGYPPGGIDPVTGQQVGPTDAELKYGGILDQWIRTRGQGGTTSAPPTTPGTQQPAQTGGSCSLQITGPSSVDRYCAAYTPAQAAGNVAGSATSCGVFPAPNITLSASGQPPGQAVTWSVVRGSAQAQIAGSSNNPNVDIRGVSASTARDDVTVQARSGACVATHRLTVRQPSSLSSRVVPGSSSATATRVAASLEYTVLDRFGSAMGPGICIDETVIECDSPFNPGVIQYQFADAPTNAQGQAFDNIFVANSSGIPAGFCVKLDQDITAGGCGPLGRNIILLQAGGITVRPGDCTPSPTSTCP